MYIYNVTIKVDHAIVKEWLHWLKQEHIPEIVATGCFTEATILELLENVDEEGITFAVQYKAPRLEDYRTYLSEHAPLLRQKGLDKWGNKFVAFRTFMKIVD
ncbi:MAG: DUF4286 family protein [Chitinophagaceae bacterium]|nr:DUF4286 family protein [Chitinophagaceae bacterium]